MKRVLVAAALAATLGTATTAQAGVLGPLGGLVNCIDEDTCAICITPTSGPDEPEICLA